LGLGNFIFDKELGSVRVEWYGTSSKLYYRATRETLAVTTATAWKKRKNRRVRD
jgi:hypothetical protein